MGISHLCGLFGFSKQAYYKRKRSLPATYNEELRTLVMEVKHQLPKCGGRKIYYLISEGLKEKGIKLGRDKLFDFLRKENLLSPKRKKYHKTTDSKHWMRKYPNKIKNLEINRPEQVWVADITYLWVRSKHYYLHLITDAYSKRIMGYQLSDNMMASQTAKALYAALENRMYDKDLVHHSDRGLQYCSREYTDILQSNNISISMTENADPYENAVAERMNGILKDEFGMDMKFENYHTLERQLVQSVYLYNHLRPHLSVDYKTHYEAHQQNHVKMKTYKKNKGSKPVLNPCQE